MIIPVLVTVLVLAAVLYAFSPHIPKAPARAASVAELEAYLDNLVASGDPPGLSVVVVKDGKVAYSHAFGLADGPHQVKATPDTVYHWWSMTKIPTAIAILQLSDQGKLSLDDPVSKYLPWFEVAYPSTDRTPITVRYLLQHSSGLPDTMPSMIGWVHYDDSTRNQTDIARKYLSNFNKLKFAPGTKASYSNYNYMLLGAVIEAITGQSYEQYMTRNILQPLGMTQTSFVYSPEMAAHESAGSLPVVHFYTPLLPFLLDTGKLIRERQQNLFWFNKMYIDATPSTGLIGPAPDVGRLMIAYMNGGTLDGRAVLSPKSIALMTETAPIDGHGLGWFAFPSGTRPFVEHAGGGPGFATNMRLYPAENLGIAILANGTDLDRSGISELIASLSW
jgi:CubicO group peptidase (beta-lactamase class C family)